MKYLIHILLLSLIVCACNQSTPHVQSQVDISNNISAEVTVDKKISAGEYTTIKVATKSIDNNESIQLLISDRFSTVVKTLSVKNNACTYDFVTNASGLVKIYLNYKGVTLDQTYILVNPLEASGKMPNSNGCLLYTSPSPRDLSTPRMPSSA